jgi:hypothetical protein
MEFLDINLTKDSNLLFHAIHRPYWRIWNKTIFSQKNPQNKKWIAFWIAWIAFCRTDKWGSKIRQMFMPRNLDKNAFQELHLCSAKIFHKLLNFMQLCNVYSINTAAENKGRCWLVSYYCSWTKGNNCKTLTLSYSPACATVCSGLIISTASVHW